MSKKVSYSEISVSRLLEEAKESRLLVPPFQRDFVWRSSDIAEFYQSVIVDEAPVGSMVIWKEIGSGSVGLRQDSKIFKALADYGSKFQTNSRRFLVDGQQRLTSFASLHVRFLAGQPSEDTQRIENITFTLEEGTRFSYSRKSVKNSRGGLFPAWWLANPDYEAFSKKITASYKENSLDFDHTKVLSLWKIYQDFWAIKCCEVEIPSNSLDEIIDIFVTLNQKGRRLSVFNICDAQFSRFNSSFTLKIAYGEAKKSLDEGWEEIDDSDMLLLHYSCIGKDGVPTIESKEILDDSKDDHYHQAHVSFLKNELAEVLDLSINILRSFGYTSLNSLPTERFLFLTASVVYDKGVKNLNQKELSILKKWFFLSILNKKYKSGAQSHDFKKDLDSLRKYVKAGEIVKLPDWAIRKKFSKDDILETDYKPKSQQGQYIWANLLLTVPSLHSGERLLITLSSKHDNNKPTVKKIHEHHIYPENNSEYSHLPYVYSMANITPLESKTNIEYSNKSPLEYLPDFRIAELKKDKSFLFPAVNLEETNSFLEERASMIADSLNSLWD